MTGSLSLDANWVDGGDAAPEERACLAQLNILANNLWLTEGYSTPDDKLMSPILSAYHLAEWLAWNWWRLRWEPQTSAAGWDFAHRMSSVGAGYVWPDITIFSDGHRTALIARPTPKREATAFRYIADHRVFLQSAHFETAVDVFLTTVLDRLDKKAVSGTNLAQLWDDLSGERASESAALRRRWEALLGFDPDDADDATLDQLASDTAEFGETAIEELAADRPQAGTVLIGDRVKDLARRCGTDGSPRDVVRLAPGGGLPRAEDVPAWRLGAEAANRLREQLGFGDQMVSNATLASLAGVQSGCLTSQAAGPIAFILDTAPAESRVVLRSKWETGRRFELARLLADRLLPGSSILFPATRSYTYRQKMQRSFAAEFLCPIEALDDMLAGDYSEDRQQDAAQHFQVSERTITSLLVNHRRIDRDELVEEMDWAA